MVLSELGERELSARLKHGTLVINSGPFKFRLASTIPAITEGLV